MQNTIAHLSIHGFKSIQHLDKLHLSALNVLIGANGTGKSNFISWFRMVGEMAETRLQIWASQQGSADRILSFGVKQTTSLSGSMAFADARYQFTLLPTLDGSFAFGDESIASASVTQAPLSFGNSHKEAVLRDAASQHTLAAACYQKIAGWKVFHFHDTSDTAGVKRWGALEDNQYLRPDASNLAAFLLRLANEVPDVYQQIRKTVQLAIPFFDDFVLHPRQIASGDEQVRLLWREQGSDYALWPSQLSDGSLRFICLATALLQPEAPSIIIIDEPELGLHPYAITLLGALLRSASQRMQVIVSTQSVPLVNEFSIDDLIIVERAADGTVFKRHNAAQFQTWLNDYSVGELWEKNILGGRPRK
jgi:predicted ATPase